MHKSLVMLKSLLEGEVSIESVGKTHVSRTPGDVTVGGHQ